MKKSLLLCVMVFSLVALLSCQRDSFMQESSDVVVDVADSNPYRVPLKEALATADLYLSKVEGNKTRGARVPQSVEYYVNPNKTRSGEAVDTLLYIVNYAEDEGFAILGADRRCRPVYGFSDEGNLFLADTLENRGLAVCLQNIKYGATYGLGFFPGDSIIQKPWNPGIPTDPIDPGFGDRVLTVIKKIEPMIAHWPSIWAQTSQFQSECPSLNGRKAVVGCVPLACAQIMSYYKWPEVLAGRSVNWDLFISTEIIYTLMPIPGMDTYWCPSGLPRFLADVGAALNVNYGIDETTADETNIKNYFYKFGYSSLGSEKSFNASSPSTILEQSPLLVFGDSATAGAVGHCWVVDGYLLYKEEWNAIDNEDHINLYSFYHCVWGYGARGNGWYVFDDNGVGGLPTTDSMVTPDEDAATYNVNRYKNLTYFSGFNPVRR